MGDVIKYLILYSVLIFLGMALIFGHYRRDNDAEEEETKQRKVGEAGRLNSRIFTRLQTLIQENMHDDHSYHYVGHRATYDKDKDCILMQVDFRGNNIHGCKVLNRVTAEIDWEGQLIRISEQPDWTGWDIAITTLSKKLPDQTA